MLRNIEQTLRIQWENYRILNEWDAKFVNNTQVIRASSKIIPIVLSQSRYRMAKYLDENVYKIGYGYGNPNSPIGLTEAEVYSLWIAEFYKKEKELRNQISFPLITQGQFDALLSLYFLTGNWRTVLGYSGVYDLGYAVRIGNWELAANMLSDGKINNNQRKKEAKIMMLADYSNYQDRNWLTVEGIQFERNRYIKKPTDTILKTQLETGYYRQTGAFLPGMTDLEKRKTVLKSR